MAATAVTSASATPASPTVAVIPAGPVMASWKAPERVKAGEEFKVSLLLDSSGPLRGVPLEIGFSNSELEVVDVVEGDFFRQGEGVSSFSQTVNLATNRIGVSVLRSDSSGAKGHGAVVELKLKARAAGPVKLQITSLKPIGIGAPVAVGELPVLTLQVQ